MARLKSTKAIFNGTIQTTVNLLVRTDAQITSDYHKLNIIRGSLIRTTRQSTLDDISERLAKLANNMGHAAPTSSSKSYLLNKVNVYKKQNSFLRYAAIHQAIINICVIYEDFIRRIILKYYEENIRRIPSNKESMKNKYLIEAILRGDNIHRTLAEKVADDLMFGSIEVWHKTLNGFGMSLQTTNQMLELFLIRNCMVHNNNKTSSQLNLFMPRKYALRSPILLSVRDVKDFKDEVYRTALIISSEYNRLFPIDGGSWI
jgi:hypothetical protein